MFELAPEKLAVAALVAAIAADHLAVGTDEHQRRESHDFVAFFQLRRVLDDPDPPVFRGWQVEIGVGDFHISIHPQADQFAGGPVAEVIGGKQFLAECFAHRAALRVGEPNEQRLALAHRPLPGDGFAFLPGAALRCGEQCRQLGDRGFRVVGIGVNDVLFRREVQCGRLGGNITTGNDGRAGIRGFRAELRWNSGGTERTRLLLFLRLAERAEFGAGTQADGKNQGPWKETDHRENHPLHFFNLTGVPQ